MLVSRALVVYTLVPPLGRLPGSDPIDRRYQTVMYSGGLRGGIAMAIALSLPDSVPAKPLFVTLAVGAVVFTLVVHGLTIEGVVRHSGPHVPPVSDRMARLEGMVAAKRRTLEEIPQAGGLFSPRVADEMRTRCGAEVVELQARLAALRGRELDDAEGRRFLHVRCFGEESALYHEMFSRGA
jgi:CPA1 family monovalent cation:H+ antiporter